MRVISPTLAGFVALAAVSIQGASDPSTANWHPLAPALSFSLGDQSCGDGRHQALWRDWWWVHARADLTCCLRLPSRWLSYQLRDRIPPAPPLRITPPAHRAAPVGKGIIKDRAPRNPDPVSRDTLPAIWTPSARVTVRPPVRRHPSAVPLAHVTGCWMGTNCPRGPARTAAIPHQHDTRRRFRVGWPYTGARPVRVRGYRHGYYKQSSQGHSERAHFGTPVMHWARASTP
jgi:hypothetical protein